MSHPETGAPEDLETAFKRAVNNLDSDAKAAGTNLTEICRETGVSRASPDRWRVKVPKTVRNVAQMQRAIREHAKAKDKE